MKIISYQKLMELPPVLSYQREKSFRGLEIDLENWQQELIALVGSQQAGQAFLKKVLRLGNMSACTSPENQGLAALKPDVALYKQIYRLVARRAPQLSELQHAARTNTYLAAAYLQPYQDWTPEELPAVSWKQLLLTLTFVQDQHILVLPDVFAEAPASEKALLLGTIRNLRQIRADNKTIFIQTRHLQEALLLADRVLVMEPSATGTIGEVIPVFFREPRHPYILPQLPAFQALRKRLHYLLTDALAGEDLVSLSTSPSWT